MAKMFFFPWKWAKVLRPLKCDVSLLCFTDAMTASVNGSIAAETTAVLTGWAGRQGLLLHAMGAIAAHPLRWNQDGVGGPRHSRGR